MTIDAHRDTDTLTAATLCAERGLHLIPVWRASAGVCPCPRGADCISPGKHPAIDSWQTAASTDLTTLRDWFAGNRHNIGVVCGPSQVVVVDVDPRNDGVATFDQLVTELGPLPLTVTADSGGGGTHYVFRRPAGDLESKLGNGVDLLRDSRQFLVEPSLHPSGGMYRWRAGLGPDETTIANLPEAWVKRIRRAQRRPASMAPIITTDARVERARRYLAKLPPAVSGDGGHTQTFNAVATVMYGFDLDPDTTRSIILSDYNPRCDPPWSERDIDHKVRSAAEHCNRERGYLLQPNRTPIISTQQASESSPATIELEPGDWSEHLLAGPKGGIRRGYHNVEVFVRLFPDYRGRWSLNTMSGEPYFDSTPVRETFAHEIRAHADRRLGFTPPLADVRAAIAVAAEQRPFHPIQQYLRSVDWDGVERLRSMASDYLHSDVPLHAEMVRRWMIGAVARAVAPGCKLDTALMLFGRQGFFKSTFFSILGGQWHSDSVIDISNKDSYQQIHAAWLYEFAELENVVHGAKESRLKAFLTSTHDTFRAPYAHAVARRARSVVICGTTNRQEILTDDTGSRRFWIVPVCAPIPRELLTEMRDQLWAEAVCAYEAGEMWWLDRELEEQREAASQDYGHDDTWNSIIAAWLRTPTLVDVSLADVLTNALDLEAARHDRASQMRAARVMKHLGWQRKQRRTGGEREWRYTRPGVTESPTDTNRNQGGW
jgi:hypothetical protein